MLLTQLNDRGLKNWTSVFVRTFEILCTVLRDTPTINFTREPTEKALAEAIFDCAKRSPGYNVCLEDCK